MLAAAVKTMANTTVEGVACETLGVYAVGDVENNLIFAN
jgi:hypothetical protein